MEVSYRLWFAVRYVHLVSVVLLAGGAAIVSALFLQRRPSLDLSTMVSAASTFEWMFWSLLGITVVTGVSNLGLKGAGLLGPGTSWGTALSIKLFSVLATAMLSLVRTEVVIRCSSQIDLPPSSARVVLGSLYGATASLMIGVLWIGLGLAHGRY